MIHLDLGGACTGIVASRVADANHWHSTGSSTGSQEAAIMLALHAGAVSHLACLEVDAFVTISEPQMYSISAFYISKINRRI